MLDRVNAPAPEPLSSYQRRLLVFLSVATFFEGYDFIALTQILPELRHDFGLSESQGGFIVGFINVGTIVSCLLVRQADRWGRRGVLTLTIAGYTTFTFLSGLAWGAKSFAAFQLVARIFLLAEWAVSMVFAAEEFPASRRGMVIGVIGAFSSLGSIVCVGVVPVLIATAWGWRTVYFVGIVPLVVLMFARRSIKESKRFSEQVGGGARHRLMHILGTPYRKRVLQMALIWGVTYVCFQTAVTFWKEFALAERGFSSGVVARSIAVAALGAMPLAFLVGPALDRVGRRRGAVLIYVAGALGVAASYTFRDPWALTAGLVFAIAASTSVLTVLNAFTTELFPTDLRADAYAWSNNLLGRVSYVLAPWVVSIAAESVGWGPAVRVTTVCPLIALVLILWLLPETASKELEETAAISSG